MTTTRRRNSATLARLIAELHPLPPAPRKQAELSEIMAVLRTEARSLGAGHISVLRQPTLGAFYRGSVMARRLLIRDLAARVPAMRDNLAKAIWLGRKSVPTN